MIKRITRRLTAGVLLLFWVMGLGSSLLTAPTSVFAGAPPAREELPQPAYPKTPQDKAAELLKKLQPQEKVGQLLLVTFTGSSAGRDTQINELIEKYHIGGVVLLSQNDNMTNPDNEVKAVWNLNRELQTDEWMGSQIDVKDANGLTLFRPNYVPLLIGITQEGDGPPNSQIISGLTPLPNEMAIGATWQPDLARQVGEVSGSELSALGINLIFGPSLDVLEDPKPEGPGDLGTRTFGGDPFWVGEMAKAYIRGVHQGSHNKITVAGKYFPGRGGSDRLPEDEVATIRKSIVQLNQIELAPFFSVTGNAPDPESTVDALLVSHIRYQGFQGNIRTTTRPVSFDPQAMQQILSLPPLVDWRKNNGLLISDDLGNKAVRRLYDPTGEVFNARLVARDAFLAGNDLLYLGNFVASTDPDSFTTITQTLSYFEQKYREDSAFAQRVDESVLRILTMKFNLYPEFVLGDVLIPMDSLNTVGSNGQVTFNVAQKAATLIDPSPSELNSLIPDPPQVDERIVFITDTYTAQQCSKCIEQPVLAVDALQQAVVKLYGQMPGAQIRRQNMISFSSDKLKDMLDKNQGMTDLEFYIRQSQWIVLGILSPQSNAQETIVMRRFLTERADLLRGKNVIVFAFNAPYYLDATDISKITAYYGLYSKLPQFVEVAARLLFNELRPIPGKPPVSVPGIGYDLISTVSPDESQTIPLMFDLPNIEVLSLTAIPAAEAARKFKIGDLIPVKTGVVVDYNGNAVPDSTPVHFLLSSVGEGGALLEEIVAPTVAGVAHATFALKSSGTLNIGVKCEMAIQSQIIKIEVPGDANAVNQVTSTAAPAPTNEPTNLPPTPTGVSQENKSGVPSALLNWLIAVFVSGGCAWGAYRLGIQKGRVHWSMRAGLLTFIGGLVVYTYTILQLPGGDLIWNTLGRFAAIVTAVIGSGLGWLLANFWQGSIEEKSR